MPRYKRGRGKRMTIEKYLRDFAFGAMMLVLSVTIIILGGHAGQAISPYAAFNVTVGGNTVTVDLGIVPVLLTSVGGVLLFAYGWRKIARARL